MHMHVMRIVGLTHPRPAFPCNAHAGLPRHMHMRAIVRMQADSPSVLATFFHASSPPRTSSTCLRCNFAFFVICKQHAWLHAIGH
jgi:hypothetical protein